MPTPEEARRLLAEATAGIRRAEAALGAYYRLWFAIWGGVYAVGYTLEALDYAYADAAFAFLSGLGFLASYALGAWVAGFFKTEAGRALSRIWAGFGGIALALVVAKVRLPEGGFSLAVNLLVALALWASAERVGAPKTAALALGFAFANALLYAYLPAYYAPALAALGLVALLLGFRGIHVLR